MENDNLFTRKFREKESKGGTLCLPWECVGCQVRWENKAVKQIYRQDGHELSYETVDIVYYNVRKVKFQFGVLTARQ